MVGMLFNNILYCFSDIYIISYLLDFIIGNSITTTFLLYVCSYVLKATRPYQDALIQCDIRRVAEHADFNLWRRTCRMISGEVVLPNTPVVEGYASYNPCHIQSTTPTPAA